MSAQAGSGGTTTGTGGTPAAAGSGGTTSTTGGTGGRASGGVGAGGTTGASGANGTLGGGQIELYTFVNYPSSGQSLTSLTAHFWSGAENDGCSHTALGQCTLYNCPSLVQNPDGPDAGAIVVSSTEAGFSQTLTFSGTSLSGSYSQYMDDKPDFVGSEHVTVTTTGGVVPAFSDQIDYPLLLLLTNPLPADVTSVITVPANQDFTLGWDRGTAGVSFLLESDPSLATFIACSVPSELGTFTLPASILAMVPSGAQLYPYTEATHSVVTGNYDVTVVLAGTVMWPDKMHRVMLQVAQ
jgi:hypothetical protein